MSRFHSYLNTAVAILTAYNGEVPFAVIVKKYFAENKKHGSRDRKEIAALCYAYFRAARLFENDTMEEKILKSYFLCSTGPNELLLQLRPDWNEKITAGWEEKCSMLNAQFSIIKLIPWLGELSEGIDTEKFAASFLVQPDLFLRLRPGREETVRNKLQEAGIPFTELSKTCLALPNTSKIDTILQLDFEAVIQDLSSQKTGELLQRLKTPAFVWDCCAASGGIPANRSSTILKNVLPQQASKIIKALLETLLIQTFHAELPTPNSSLQITISSSPTFPAPAAVPGHVHRNSYSILRKKKLRSMLPCS